MSEGDFKKDICDEIKRCLPGCMILKNDPTFIQGIPDLLVLFNDRWAAMEIKKFRNATHRPNQDYYINKMDLMSFARIVYPENREEVLDELYKYFMEE